MAEQNLLPLIVKTISGTPTWVWFIFAYLIFVGIRATKTRPVYIPKLFIVPVVISGLMYKTFMSGSTSLWIGYFTCLFFSSLFSFKFLAMQNAKITKEGMFVKLPGTYWTLLALVSIFIVKYSFGYISATQPALYKELQGLELSISGLFSGYFLGKAVNYFLLFKKRET